MIRIRRNSVKDLHVRVFNGEQPSDLSVFDTVQMVVHRTFGEAAVASIDNMDVSGNVCSKADVAFNIPPGQYVARLIFGKGDVDSCSEPFYVEVLE